MDENRNVIMQKWSIELLWWALSILFCIIIVLPIWLKVPEFPFLSQNILYILIFFNGMRYLFLLKNTPFSYAIAFKFVVIFITIPILVYQIDWMSMFQEFKDDGELLHLLEELPFEDQKGIRKYIENEFIFFGVASIITTFLLPFRMIVSIWRVKNRGSI